MLKNYLKIAWRNLARRKSSTVITASGLVLGIAAFLFILQYVVFEFSVNAFHEQRGQIYRVLLEEQKGEIEVMLPPGTAQIAKQEIAGIKSATRFSSDICNGVVRVEKNPGEEANSFRESKCLYTDSGFLELFSFHLIHGEGSLELPNSAVITASLAEKYFGTANATGRTFTLYNQFDETSFTVTGVVEDVRGASDIQFEMALSFTTLENPANREGNEWVDPAGMQNGFTQNFLLLNDEANTATITQSLQQLKDRLDPDDEAKVRLQPLDYIHLAPAIGYPFPTSGSLAKVLLLLGIGILILAIAWANYVNLSTAYGLDRAKQIGVQKVVGATRRQLIGQYLLETLMLGAMGCILAIVLVELTQPLFNRLIGKSLSLEILNYGFVWAGAAFFLLTMVIAAGGYVGFVLTSLQPKEILKGSKGNAGRGLVMRKSLVVLQFAVSSGLIVATLVFYNQLQYMQGRDLGMSLDERLVVQGPSVIIDKETRGNSAFKNELAAFSFIEKYAGSNGVPGKGYNFFASHITNMDPQPGDEKKSFAMLMVDQHYLDTFDINLVKGENFKPETVANGWESRSLIINERAARQLQFDPAEAAAGQKVLWGDNEYEVVGVIKDYHHSSLQALIDPMILLPNNANAYYTVKMPIANVDRNIASLKTAFETHFPGNPFEYFFIQDTYDQQYASEKQFEQIFIIASLLAIFIACMGLFGLAAFAAATRTKEIGVRKVLGATVSDIVGLLSKDFIKLVTLGFLIAAPIAWYAMNRWLADFAYRTDIGPGVFLIAGSLALLIALITVSWQSIRAALMNPVESLRSE